MLNPDIGGAALWDLGIYPLTFTHLVYGGDAPETIESLMVPAAETGVDEMSTLIARYPKGHLAMLQSGFRLQAPHQTRIHGTKGRVVVDDFFHPRVLRSMAQMAGAKNICTLIHQRVISMKLQKCSAVSG